MITGILICAVMRTVTLINLIVKLAHYNTNTANIISLNVFHLLMHYATHITNVQTFS